MFPQIQNQEQINLPNNMLNPMSLANFNFDNNINNNNLSQYNNQNNMNNNKIENSMTNKPINPDNPEEILMDENFWNNLPNKKNELTSIQNHNVINTNQSYNFNNQIQPNYNVKNSIMDFNLNNSDAPIQKSITIPEFSFDLPNLNQASIEKSFNINNVHGSNFDFNNNLNKSISNNFNLNTFDKNISNKLNPPGANNFYARRDDIAKKQISYDFNFINLLQNDNSKLNEDEFDPISIRKQIRGAIIVIIGFLFFIS